MLRHRTNHKFCDVDTLKGLQDWCSCDFRSSFWVVAAVLGQILLSLCHFCIDVSALCHGFKLCWAEPPADPLRQRLHHSIAIQAVEFDQRTPRPEGLMRQGRGAAAPA